MKPVDLADVESLLPRSARMLVSAIGLAATAELVRQMPGVQFVVPRCASGKGAARFEMLAECIGYPAAQRLCQHFGGEALEVPTCASAMNELTRRQVRADFDRLTREHSAREAVFRLAIKYRMTSRSIWRMTKVADRGAPRPATSERQPSLF